VPINDLISVDVGIRKITRCDAHVGGVHHDQGIDRRERLVAIDVIHG